MIDEHISEWNPLNQWLKVSMVGHSVNQYQPLSPILDNITLYVQPWVPAPAATTWWVSTCLPVAQCMLPVVGGSGQQKGSTGIWACRARRMPLHPRQCTSPSVSRFLLRLCPLIPQFYWLYIMIPPKSPFMTTETRPLRISITSLHE